MKNKSMLDTAMILAAGFGKRLMPLTGNTPKALVEYKGKPMVYHVIRKLESSGIKKIVINTHHLAHKMNEYFANNSFNSDITLIHETRILGTGGAIKNAGELLKGTGNFLVYNADVDSDIDLQKMNVTHLENKALATLAVKERSTSRYLLKDGENNLLGRTENDIEVFYRESRKEYFKTAFCGIHIISEDIFEYFPNNENFDIIPEYLKLINNGKTIKVYEIGDAKWFDIGSQVIET